MSNIPDTAAPRIPMERLLVALCCISLHRNPQAEFMWFSTIQKSKHSNLCSVGSMSCTITGTWSPPMLPNINGPACSLITLLDPHGFFWLGTPKEAWTCRVDGRESRQKPPSDTYPILSLMHKQPAHPYCISTKCIVVIQQVNLAPSCSKWMDEDAFQDCHSANSAINGNNGR